MYNPNTRNYNYKYMKPVNFAWGYNLSNGLHGALIGSSLGALSTVGGNIGENETLPEAITKRALIGAGLGGAAGVAGGLLAQSGKLGKYEHIYKEPINDFNPEAILKVEPRNPIPKLKTQKDVEQYMQGKPGNMSTSEVEAALNDPNHEWVL